MSLQSAIEAELPFLQAQAESRMISSVNVRRSSGPGSQDETTGVESAGWTVVYADLPFRLDGTGSSDGGSRVVKIGGVEYQQATAAGHMPASTKDLRDDDVIHIMSGEWPDTYWRIVEAVKGDQKTARRVPIVGIDKPEGWT